MALRLKHLVIGLEKHIHMSTFDFIVKLFSQDFFHFTNIIPFDFVFQKKTMRKIYSTPVQTPDSLSSYSYKKHKVQAFFSQYFAHEIMFALKTV